MLIIWMLLDGVHNRSCSLYKEGLSTGRGSEAEWVIYNIFMFSAISVVLLAL